MLEMYEVWVAFSEPKHGFKSLMFLLRVLFEKDNYYFAMWKCLVIYKKVMVLVGVNYNWHVWNRTVATGAAANHYTSQEKHGY